MCRVCRVVYPFRESSTEILFRERFWKTLHDGAPLHCARISHQVLKPPRAGIGGRARCHSGVTSDALGAKGYAETLIGLGFGACRWRGPTDVSGTAYLHFQPNCSPE